ncbi:MAG TPA: nicotinate phosphoribosyltransferase [archaeon]|nr:nicotinate phosphoribosyltransferase [archaeon]
MLPRDNALATDLYELTMAAAYFENKESGEATFELFVRQLPGNRSYLIAAGLEQVVEYLRGLRFEKDHINFLMEQPSFRDIGEGFFRYLSEFRFTGDVWALPEGTVFFANEPVLRVTAPIIEAQIIETYLLSTINFETLIATKASRVVQSARGREVVEFGARRAHGPEAALLAARSSYIGGCVGTSNVLAGFKFGIPIYGTMAHSFVMNYETEEEAFNKFCKTFPSNPALLLDTYDTIKALQKAIPLKPSLVRLDSGDRYDLSVKVRKILDDAGLKQTKIFVSGDLNEFIIDDLTSKGAPIDTFGVGTELVTSRDEPALQGIYKIVETRRNGELSFRVKTSEGKRTLPGAKQVYREYSSAGEITQDVLALADEDKIPLAEPLLVEVLRRGRLVYRLPRLCEVRERALKNTSNLPAEFRDIRKAQPSPVILSERLQRLSESLWERPEEPQRGWAR